MNEVGAQAPGDDELRMEIRNVSTILGVVSEGDLDNVDLLNAALSRISMLAGVLELRQEANLNRNMDRG